MSMDEKEVQALQEKVGDVDAGDPTVQAWIVAVLGAEEVSLKKLRAEFRMHKLMRDDAAMTAVSARVETTKKRIEALTEMQSAGGAKDTAP